MRLSFRGDSGECLSQRPLVGSGQVRFQTLRLGAEGTWLLSTHRGYAPGSVGAIRVPVHGIEGRCEEGNDRIHANAWAGEGNGRRGSPPAQVGTNALATLMSLRNGVLRAVNG